MLMGDCSVNLTWKLLIMGGVRKGFLVERALGSDREVRGGGLFVFLPEKAIWMKLHGFSLLFFPPNVTLTKFKSKGRKLLS